MEQIKDILSSAESGQDVFYFSSLKLSFSAGFATTGCDQMAPKGSIFEA
jgi:hypothetical protein